MSVAISRVAFSQEKQADTGAPRAAISVDARLVMVPVVVSDKKGLVTTLGQQDFALSVEGKPQTIRYFDHDNDVPLTVGLLVDVSHSQTGILGEEQKAGQAFLDSLLKPAGAQRPADKAFVMQFAHTAELLQDVTDSHPLLAAGLKEVGTEAPGAADETETADTKGDTAPATGNGNPNQGGYGRRNGYPRDGSDPGSGTGQRQQARGGTVLYDALFLASGEVMNKQKGRRALVVLSDGVDRHSKESLKEAIEAAQRADTTVYAIYYKGQDPRPLNRSSGGYPGGGYPGGGYPGGGYPGSRYPGYGRPSYPGSGGSPGSDGTYADPDGRKILQQICAETGGRLFEAKSKGSLEGIYGQIGDELRAQYRIGFTPTLEASGAGYHAVQLSLTNPANNHFELQTREGFYGAETKPRE